MAYMSEKLYQRQLKYLMGQLHEIKGLARAERENENCKEIVKLADSTIKYFESCEETSKQ